jgi:glyoxylase-like metal-dependent hydrolase (beta-lactamase superfamily II)
VICCWQAGEALIDPGPSSCLDTLLAALGDERPRALLLTHIHLDHAGATGALLERWPDLEVYVHEVGAPHLIDPSRLLASASRLYDDMERRWGPVAPVPEDRVRVLRGGETVAVGEDRFAVAATPGHASHHVCYLHEESGRAFTGDMAGVRVPGSEFTLVPTPPPEIDVEAWGESLDKLDAWAPSALGLTHFGAVDDGIPEQLERVREGLARWSELARSATQDEFVGTLREAMAAAVGEADAASLAQAAVPEQLYQGLERYWRKRAERAA